LNGHSALAEVFSSYPFIDPCGSAGLMRAPKALEGDHWRRAGLSLFFG